MTAMAGVGISDTMEWGDCFLIFTAGATIVDAMDTMVSSISPCAFRLLIH